MAQIMHYKVSEQYRRPAEYLKARQLETTNSSQSKQTFVPLCHFSPALDFTW